MKTPFIPHNEDVNSSRFTRGELIMMLVALVYIVSPVDLLPELIAGPLGLTDDAAAVAAIMAIVTQAVRRPKTVTVPVQE